MLFLIWTITELSSGHTNGEPQTAGIEDFNIKALPIVKRFISENWIPFGIFWFDCYKVRIYYGHLVMSDMDSRVDCCKVIVDYLFWNG